MSLYKLRNTRLNQLRNRGFDYRGRIFLRNTDPNLYKNVKLNNFVVRLEAMVQNWFDTTKKIKLFRNYNFEKDDIDIIN